jgi:hypothetical protein
LFGFMISEISVHGCMVLGPMAAAYITAGKHAGRNLFISWRLGSKGERKRPLS